MKITTHYESILQGLSCCFSDFSDFNVMMVIMKSKKKKVGKNLSVCPHTGFDDIMSWSWTQASLPIMEDDSLGYHGIMKILCNAHFIGYEVIKQKVSQLLLPWEVLMMPCSKCHGCCLNGESVSPFISEQERTPPTGGPLKPLLHLERSHCWSRKHFFPAHRPEKRW